MSFLNSDDNASKSGAGKFIVLALVVLIGAGGAYWWLNHTPEPVPEPEVEARPPAVEDPAPPPPPPKARKADVPSSGSLVVTANVEGATVFIDDERVGPAPFENNDIAIGMYSVRVTKEGYEDFLEDVRVRPGGEAALRASLDLLPPSLRVVSDVTGATVFLDREYKGTTPIDIKGVSAGKHQLTVSAEGYDMYAETVTITTGHRDVTINFEQAVAAFSESIPVIHKHTFGDCKGTLSADANGMRYETEHKDAFAAPYASLERFELDYIEKNMNFKVRKGKNYNFTEQSGNADALFLFHKNVQAFLDKM